MKSRYTLCSSGNLQPNPKVLCVMVRDTIQDVGQTFIVPDALDECCERELLIEIINDMRQHEPRKTHIYLASRSFPDVEE